MSKDKIILKAKITKTLAIDLASNIHYKVPSTSLTNTENKLVNNVMKRGLKYKDEYNDMCTLAVRLNMLDILETKHGSFRAIKQSN